MKVLSWITGVCLLLGIGILGFSLIRSVVIATERARMMEEEIVDLQQRNAELSHNLLVCYDELGHIKRKIYERRSGKQ